MLECPIRFKTDFFLRQTSILGGGGGTKHNGYPDSLAPSDPEFDSWDSQRFISLDVAQINGQQQCLVISEECRSLLLLIEPI